MLRSIERNDQITLHKAYEYIQILEQHRLFVAHFAYYAVAGYSEHPSNHFWMELPKLIYRDDSLAKKLDSDASLNKKMKFIYHYMVSIESTVQQFIENLDFSKEAYKVLTETVNFYLERSQTTPFFL
jgi:hypothetical protein